MAVSSFSPLSKFNTTNIAKLWSGPCRAKRNTRPCPDFPASLHRTVPVRSAQLTLFTPTLHYFIHYSYIIHFFQNDVTPVLDVDCHSMLYLFYEKLINPKCFDDFGNLIFWTCKYFKISLTRSLSILIALWCTGLSSSSSSPTTVVLGVYIIPSKIIPANF